MSRASKPEPAATWEPIDSVLPWDKNPNQHPEAQLVKLQALIERTAWGAIVVAQKSSRRIIAGHGRQVVARRMGMDKIPVRFVDVTDEQAAMMALADNQLPTLAETDDDLLAEVLRGLDANDLDLSSLGWTAEELDGLMGMQEDRPEPSDDVPDVQDEVHSQPGEVYALGVHRLVCGDSTRAETWATLLGEERLRMVWTDPPYGVNYVGGTAKALTIRNDDLDNDGLDAFLGAAFDALITACTPGAAVYVAAPAGPRGVPFAVQLLARGMFRQRLVWVKSAMVLGHSDYHYKHEDIYFGYVPGAAGRMGRGGSGWYGDNSQTSVLEHDKPSRNDEHPTMKPIALVRQCVENSSDVGWLVGDPFGGSGTTLLACAATGRTARLIELDPKYCDVIRRRWTRYAREAGIDPGPGALEG